MLSDNGCLAFLFLLALIGLMLMDGYAIHHGQKPMLFGPGTFFGK